MKTKAERSIVGIVCKVSLPCGCYALVAHGLAGLRGTSSRHLSAHVCPNWKRHKYDLAEAEKDLAQRMLQTRKRTGPTRPFLFRRERRKQKP